jgi:replicative DNA helicase
MTQNQIIRRLWESFAGRPKEDREIILPKFIQLPIDMQEDEKLWGIRFDTEFREGFPRDRDLIEQEMVRLKRYLKRGRLKLITLPARSATTKDINNHLTNLMIYEDFIPDVIIIDYADLLSPGIRQEHRHQLDDIWAELRKMAIEWDSCLITVSQSNRGSANSDLSEESIAEDIRKIAHVTKMIGINQTRKEHNRDFIDCPYWLNGKD